MKIPTPIEAPPQLQSFAEEWALREAKLWDVNMGSVAIGAAFLKRGYIRGTLDAADKVGRLSRHPRLQLGLISRLHSLSSWIASGDPMEDPERLEE